MSSIYEISFIILFAVLLGMGIGYVLAKNPSQNEEEEEPTIMNHDLDVDLNTGIVSDSSYSKRR